jgi:sn-glycerol 3-phosphate transport system substrate-binding protein
VRPSRRDLLRACAACFAGTAAGVTACRPQSRPLRENGRIVVTFWYAFGDLVRKVLLEAVARFNASQSRIVVKAVHQGDYFESLAKLRTAVAAGAAPTLSHVVLEVLPYLARAGVLEPLDAYEGAQTIPFLAPLAQAGSFDGGEARLYGIPFNRSTPIVYANARMLDAAGVRLPTTWDELERTAQALTVRGSDTRWGYEVPISWWYWVALVGQAGGSLVAPDGAVTLGGAAGEDALALWQRLVNADRVMRPPPGRDYQAWQSTNESFLQERIAMMWSSTAFVRYLENNARFPVVAGPLPGRERKSVPTGGTNFVLMRSAPDEEKQAGWEFVRYMCEDDQVTLWSTRTGYLPTTRTAAAQLADSGYYRLHPNDRVALDQLVHVTPWPWAPELFRIERDIVEPILEDAVLTGRNPRAALDQARADAKVPA